LIKKAVATDGFGRVTSIKFSSQKVNPPLEGKLFQFHPDDSMRVVFNPLVND
jgi:outer membrane lipoprotein carrier protein